MSLWPQPDRWLVVVASFTDQDRQVTLKPVGDQPTARFAAAWLAADLHTDANTATLTVPALRGALLTV
ncbi:MAG TPA: hypothetical protein VM283_05835, partial [Armatimonadota bacterium]|nr:hypothetical protein [Armatimonadota bacterium]